MIKNLLLRLIVVYRKSDSRIIIRLSRSCIFYPTCSKYGYLAISRYGFLYGGVLTAKRVYRCCPSRSIGGHDPVPK